MIMYVVRVKVGGETKYIKGVPTVYNKGCLVDSPWEATRYKTDDPTTCGDLREHLGWIRVPGDKMYAKNGIEVDETPEIITFKMHLEEIDSSPSRGGREEYAA